MRLYFLSLLMVLGACLPVHGQDCDFRTADIYGSPAEIRDWPVGVTITKLTMSPERDYGLHFDFEPRQSWPDIIPSTGGPNGGPWDGPLQYTVWACAQVPGGKWGAAGFIQMWRNRESTGAPLLQRTSDGKTNWRANWAYDGRWGALSTIDVTVGTRICFLVVAGNSRAGWAVETAVRQRSEPVCINLPADDRGTFEFSGSVPPTTPTVPPVVVPPVTPPAVPSAELESLRQAVAEVSGRVAVLEAQAVSQHNTMVQYAESFNALSAQVVELQSRPIVESCQADLFGTVAVRCKIIKRVP